MLLPDHVSTIICIKTYPVKYSSKINRICCENLTEFLFPYKNQRIPNGVQIRKSFDVSVLVKYSYHFLRGGLLLLLQWYVNQNKIALGFPKINFIHSRKVTSFLSEKVCFSVIASKSLKLLRLTFSEQDSNLKPGLHISRKDCKHMFAYRFFKLSTYALVFT